MYPLCLRNHAHYRNRLTAQSNTKEISKLSQALATEVDLANRCTVLVAYDVAIHTQ